MQINEVYLSGNLGKDPELFYTADNKLIVSVNVCNTSRYKTKSGEWTSQSTWVTVKAFEPTSKNAQELKKGDSVIIRGTLVENSWDDKVTGKQRSKLELKAIQIHKLERPEVTPSSMTAGMAHIKAGTANVDLDPIPF